MLTDVKNILSRSPAALLQDAAGIAAICVMMVVALHLPTLI